MNQYNLTMEQITAYRTWLSGEEKSAGTIEKYLRDIGAFARWLKGAPVSKDRTSEWKTHLLAQGYAPVTINSMLAALNGLFHFLGWDECRSKFLRIQRRLFREERRELTRGEYLRLLSTARVLEKERLYLLVKVFGSTGLSVGELPRLTAEALDGRGPSPVRLPPPLAEELRGYAARQGITAGPVCRSRNGQPMRRTQVTGEIRSLCRDARVPEEKGNPRCLRRLWQETQDAIRVSVDQLVVQAFDQMMEAEQFSVGWDAGKGVGMM